jgi:NADH:ubiquinone oxidoreductase subunit E
MCAYAHAISATVLTQLEGYVKEKNYTEIAQSLGVGAIRIYAAVFFLHMLDR